MGSLPSYAGMGSPSAYSVLCSTLPRASKVVGPAFLVRAVLDDRYAREGAGGGFGQRVRGAVVVEGPVPQRHLELHALAAGPSWSHSGFATRADGLPRLRHPETLPPRPKGRPPLSTGYCTPSRGLPRIRQQGRRPWPEGLIPLSIVADCPEPRAIPVRSAVCWHPGLRGLTRYCLASDQSQIGWSAVWSLGWLCVYTGEKSGGWGNCQITNGFLKLC